MTGRGLELGRRVVAALLSACLPALPLVAVGAASPATSEILPPDRLSAPGPLELAQSASPPPGRSSAQDPASSAPQDSETGSQVFTFPVYDVYRLNYCLRSDGGCGEPAATEWCRLKGFDRAVAWQKDDNIGGLFPTFLIEDERICAQYNCDGFAEITCSR